MTWGGSSVGGRLVDGTAGTGVGVFAKELHEKVILNTSASPFDMRYKKKGSLQDVGSERDTTMETPLTTCQEL